MVPLLGTVSLPFKIVLNSRIWIEKVKISSSDALIWTNISTKKSKFRFEFSKLYPKKSKFLSNYLPEFFLKFLSLSFCEEKNFKSFGIKSKFKFFQNILRKFLVKNDEIRVLGWS